MNWRFGNENGHLVIDVIHFNRESQSQIKAHHTSMCFHTRTNSAHWKIMKLPSLYNLYDPACEVKSSITQMENRFLSLRFPLHGNKYISPMWTHVFSSPIVLYILLWTSFTLILAGAVLVQIPTYIEVILAHQSCRMPLSKSLGFSLHHFAQRWKSFRISWI